MKMPVWTLLLFAPAQAWAQEATIEAVNPSDFPRAPETVEVRWADLPLRSLNPDSVAVFEGDVRIASQVIRMSRETGPRLLFQSSFRPAEKKTFRLRTAAGPGTFSPLVDARFVLPRQDVAWESDRIAFRIYGSVLAGDVNNGIDVWTKRVRYPVVAKWYRKEAERTGGKESYHEDTGEGADFFNVGRSLGAGGAGLWQGGKLYQPGLFTAHEILASGPIRAAFRVTYEKGTMEGKPFREVETISIDGGSSLNRIEITYSGTGDADTIAFLAGLVKRKGVAVTFGPEHRWVSLWGQTDDDPVNGELGTGVVMPSGVAHGLVNDSVHAGLLGDGRSGRTAVYYAGAGWTRSGDFASASDWNAYLAGAARRLDAPLRVRVR